jgi:hypothetical protein
MKIRIEKGIPIPARRTPKDIDLPIDECLSLEVGDSFFYSATDVHGIQNKILDYFKRKIPGMKITTRSFLNGIRIWRIY